MNFDDFYKRACIASGAKTQMELAAILGINRSAITQAKRRNSIPEKWLLGISRKFAVSPDWLEHGDKFLKTPTRQSAEHKNTINSIQPTVSSQMQSVSLADGSPLLVETLPEIFKVPKISAVLCAGGGSFEVDTTVVGEIPMPFPVLRRFGSPGSMVFMDVAGDSMEPGIFDGDTVLIDQSSVEYQANSIMAVGYEDTIFLKRLKKNSDGSLALLSDNPVHSPIYIYGDEFDSFRIIGRLVWLCRNFI